MLVNLLNDRYVICHPFIVSEMACGYLKNGSEILLLLQIPPSFLFFTSSTIALTNPGIV